MSEAYRRGYLKLRSVLHDRTTGLPAFPLLLDDLRTALDDRRAIGLLHVETEGLEQVESLYGWQVLDRVLLRLRRALDAARGAAVPRDVLLAVDRVAGDRFLVFVTAADDGGEVDADWLKRAGGRLRREIETRLEADDDWSGLGPRLRVHVGHALLAQDPFYRFERRVYAALAQAQRYPGERARRRVRSWGDELRRIIRDRAVHTLFQPVVSLRSGALLGYEAFARGPKDTPLEMPRDMFAASSAAGIEADLDRACREAALREVSSIGGPAAKLFLNARRAGVDEAGLARNECGREVVLEFSEREADADAERFAAALARTQGLGFGVALDDVGTGHVGQGLLDRVRPDYLKLDVSLVHEIDRNLIKQEILHAVVRIAERVGAAVIAEGVETEAEARTLSTAGAEFAQGHLFAAPTPAAAFAAGAPSGPARAT